MRIRFHESPLNERYARGLRKRSERKTKQRKRGREVKLKVRGSRQIKSTNERETSMRNATVGGRRSANNKTRGNQKKFESRRAASLVKREPRCDSCRETRDGKKQKKADGNVGDMETPHAYTSRATTSMRDKRHKVQEERKRKREREKQNVLDHVK